MKRKLPVADISIFGCALLLLFLAAFAIRVAWAAEIAQDVAAARAVFQKRFLELGTLPQLPERNALLELVAYARELDIQNPELLENKALLLSMPVETNDFDRAAMQFQGDAVTEFVAAVAARPVSAYAWINLASIRYQAGKVDTQFYAALENAALLGPWEPDVQLKVIDLGLAVWPEMPQALQAVVAKVLGQAQQHYASKVFEIAARRGRLDLLCRFERKTAVAESMMAEVLPGPEVGCRR